MLIFYYNTKKIIDQSISITAVVAVFLTCCSVYGQSGSITSESHRQSSRHFGPLFSKIPSDVSGEDRGLAVSNLNNDGWAAPLFTVVNQPVMSLINTGNDGHHSFAVDLTKDAVCAPEARVEVVYADNSARVAEIYVGNGYLPQSEAKLFFGYTKEHMPKFVQVRWSDGRLTKVLWKQGAEFSVVPNELVSMTHA